MNSPPRQPPSPAPNGNPQRRRRKSLSMHEGKAHWCDCCSCEAEERWAELAEEFGIDLSDDEPDDR